MDLSDMTMPKLPTRAAALVAAALLALAPAPIAAQQGRIGPQSISPLAEKLIDAVVNISTTTTTKGAEGVPLPRVPKGSPFEEFFDDFFTKRAPGGRGGQDRKSSSLGSGFVINAKEGLIVTNNHVIEGADEIIANFHDGSKLKVEKVLGRDTKTDLALLQVKPGRKPLAEVKFGTSGDMKLGDWVMAIGNPFGLGGSVSVGIISSKERDIGTGQYDDFIQTDAAINKGNSGGPLFNMSGEVIGVNTAIISPGPGGGSIGIGFAVPSDMASLIADQLHKFGETRRGWLGVKVRSITDDIAESLGVVENVGALVESVAKDGPAAKAGITDGDIITRFDGKDISTSRGLPKVVARTPHDKEVVVELLRKGQKQTIKVMVGRLKEDEDKKAAAPEPKKDQPKSTEQAPAAKQVEGAFPGVKFTPLDDASRKQFSIDPKVAKGIVVTEVDPTSPAALKGLRTGEVIVEVAQDPVTSIDDMAKAIDKVRKAGRKALLLRVEDPKGEMRFVAVQMP